MQLLLFKIQNGINDLMNVANYIRMDAHSWQLIMAIMYIGRDICMLSFLIFLIIIVGIVVFGVILCIIITAHHKSEEQQEQEDERQLEFIRAYKERKEKH